MGAVLKIARIVVAAALIVVAAPVSLVAAGSAAAAWMAGWPPGRLYRAALCCLPMLAVWLAATAAAHSAAQVAAAPYLAWLTMWHQGAAGAYPAAAAAIAPAAIPAGLAAGGLAWAYRIRSMETGSGGLSPDAPVTFDLRQWRHQARTARARIAAPGSIPLTRRSDSVLVGAVIRAVGQPARRIASIPYARMRSHQLVLGTSGTGKTTLLLRLWAGFMATALRRHAAGRGLPPLLVVLDGKGGADARRIADRARRVLRMAGARSTAVWPDEASLSLWALPPAQLITTLVDLIEHGTGAAAYYADVMEAVVGLAIGAPCGPPGSSADFLARLDPGWLTAAYSPGEHEAELALIRSASRQFGDIGLRFRTLFRRSAVSRRLPIWDLYERARSLGLAVQVSAQSWPGLAAGEDERYRIAAAADGGIWLLRTPQPEPVAALAGTRKVVDTTRRLLGIPVWSHQGSSRVRLAPVVDPALIRALDVGQAAYIYRGGVTYVQVKRLVAAPAALPGPRTRPAQERRAADTPAEPPGPPQLPDVSALLDEAFGAEAAP